jgi:hypothetical protein
MGKIRIRVNYPGSATCPDYVLTKNYKYRDFCLKCKGTNRLVTVQGGSDKSGIFLLYLLNGTTQLKIIRFYCSEKKIADIHIEN